MIFTFLFGGAVGGSIDAYIGYLVPGILVMTLLVTTGTTGAALSIDLATGVYDRYRTLSIRPGAALDRRADRRPGPLCARLAVVIALGLALGFRPAGGAPGVLAAVLLVLVFSGQPVLALDHGGAGHQDAGRGARRDPGGAVPAVACSATSSSTPATLPGWLQAFVDVNPVSHLVTAVRDLMAGGTPVGQVAGSWWPAPR